MVSGTESLTNLALMLAAGSVEVVNFTGKLEHNTPILQLPEDFPKNTPKVEIHKISEYDNDGPFFAWNWMKLGEHSGTHFGAPHHWITGTDYEDGFTDTLDVRRLITPVNVVDCSKQAAANEDFLLTADGIRAWEAEHGEIGKGGWVLMRTDWYKRAGDEAMFLNADDTAPHSPGPTPDCMDICCPKGSLAGALNVSEQVPGRLAGWNRHILHIICCTATIALVWPALQTLTSCRPTGSF
ncbi:MAG: kynurenine formamidase [Akkermansiaceae bacterium]|jgi:kynurenine formamidase